VENSAFKTFSFFQIQAFIYFRSSNLLVREIEDQGLPILLAYLYLLQKQNPYSVKKSQNSLAKLVLQCLPHNTKKTRERITVLIFA
jgi:hypothetical protein